MKTPKWFKPATSFVGAGILAVALAGQALADEDSDSTAAVPAAAVTVGDGFIDVTPNVEFKTATLRVAGPSGYALSKTISAEEGEFYLTVDLLMDAEPPAPGNVDLQLVATGALAPQHWTSLVDGRYYYEVVFTSGDGSTKRETGAFRVQDGIALQKSGEPLSQTADEEPGLLARIAGSVLDVFVPSAHAQSGDFDDFVSIRNTSGTGSSRLNLNSSDSIGVDDDSWRLINDDAEGHRFDINEGLNTTRFSILQGGNVGIGTTAPAAGLHVVSSTSRFEAFGNAWNLNPGSVGFWINEVGGQGGILKAQVGAPTDSLVMSPTGVGVGTDDPAFPLHVQSADPGVLRISTSSTNVDFEAGPAGLLIADTDGDRIFWAQHARSTANSISLQGNGAGFGTSTPQYPIHVFRSDNTAQVRVEDTGVSSPQVLFSLIKAGYPQFQLQNTAQPDFNWTFRLAGNSGSNERFEITKVGTGSAEFELFADGSANFRGDVTANGVLLTSTREAKTDFRALDERDVLDKLASLEISQWRYKHEDEDTVHFGPVAEEFHEVFGLSDGKRLNMIDTNGIAFAAIKALNSENEALKAENREIKDRLAALERSLLD